MNESLALMLKYNGWANGSLLEALRDVDDFILDTRPFSDERSIRETVMHLVGAQQTFVLRTMGRQHEHELQETDPWPGFDRLEDLATESGDQLIAIARDLDVDIDVVLPYMGLQPVFPKSFFLVHAVEHAIEHRTEIKVALHHLGIDTPDLDGWLFAGAMGFGAEALS